jgi:hypothetical protein
MLSAMTVKSSSISIAPKDRRNYEIISVVRRVSFQRSKRPWRNGQRTYAPNGQRSMDYPKNEIKEDEIEAANKRAAARLAKTPTAVRARYDRHSRRLVINLSTGFQIALKPLDLQGLEEAKPEQLTKIEISPSGFGIHFPDLDVDLYLPALLEGIFGSRKWIASQLGKTGGRSTSAAKTAASRRNGKRGGRPKKKLHISDAAYIGHGGIVNFINPSQPSQTVQPYQTKPTNMLEYRKAKQKEEIQNELRDQLAKYMKLEMEKGNETAFG